MNNLKKVASLVLFMLTGLFGFAQSTAQKASGVNDFMNSNGKIYVVVAVIVVIVVALFFYLFTLDRKITKLEKEHHQP